MYFHSSREEPERTADPAQRRANLRRIGPLFKPYRVRLTGLLLLIVVSAGLGVIPAFLLKRVLEAIGRNDTTELSLAAGRLARQLDKVAYRHVRRAQNELADRLVNEALDSG